MGEKPWMWSIFSGDEIKELLDNSSRIVWDQENGLIIHLTMSNNQCMDFMHHYFITRETEILDAGLSIEFIEGFLFDMVSNIEQHLDREVPDWQERYYGVEPSDGDSDSSS